MKLLVSYPLLLADVRKEHRVAKELRRLPGVTEAQVVYGEDGVVTVAPDIAVQRLVSGYFLVHTHDGYPVVQNGRLLGIVTLQCVRALPRDQWNNTTVGDIMVSCERAVTIQPEAAALDAMAKMAHQKVGRLLVTGKEGQLQGVMTNGDLMRAMQVRIDLGP